MPIVKPESTSLGWGRAAVNRFAKSEEEIKADILKALEGKLSVEFQDYAQWQRVSVEGSTSTQPSAKSTLKPKSATTATTSAKSTSVSRSSCSSLCFHPWNKKDLPPDLSAENEKNQRATILQTKISAKKISIHEYRRLKKFLQTSNAALRGEIIGTEGDAHRAVTQLLEKFEKYNAASKVLANKHANEVDVAKMDYHRTRNDVDNDLSNLERDVNALDRKLNIALNDLEVLRTYKDKIYPVKALTVSRLQMKMKTLEQDHKGEENDLSRITHGERNQMALTRAARAQAILSDAADTAYRTAAPKAMHKIATNNVVLAYEIQNHIQAIEKLEREIQVLTEELMELSLMKESNVKKYVFPELFVSSNRCDPDDDIVLDIPVEQFLPI